MSDDYFHSDFESLFMAERLLPVTPAPPRASFSNLAIELRNMIWQVFHTLSLPDYGTLLTLAHAFFTILHLLVCHRVYANIHEHSADMTSRELLCYSSRDIYLKFGLNRGAVHQKAQVYLELDLPKLSPSSLPLVLQINTESRRYAQEKGHLWFYHEKLAAATSLNDSLQFSGTFLNINLDRFIIDCDFVVQRPKTKEFLLQGLKGFKNIELWYDRMDLTFDWYMLCNILVEKPERLVVREIVDHTGNSRHSDYCYCSLCQEPEEDPSCYTFSEYEISYYTSLGLDIGIIQACVYNPATDSVRPETDMRLVRYNHEVEECQQKLFDLLIVAWDCDERFAASVVRKIIFKRGIVSVIDWYARTRTKHRGSGMI